MDDLMPISHMETDEVADLILDLAATAIEQRGTFSLVVSGGATPAPLYERLRSGPAAWKSWLIILGDDRCLDAAHPGRNESMLRSVWIDHVPVRQFIAPPAGYNPRESAAAFAQSVSGLDIFDLCLLGIGSDGHTAGLFSPHHLILAGDAIGHGDGPPPHTTRVTLSASRLRRTRRTIFLVGPEKKIVKELIAGVSVIPFAAAAPQRRVIVLTEPTTLPQMER